MNGPKFYVPTDPEADRRLEDLRRDIAIKAMAAMLGSDEGLGALIDEAVLVGTKPSVFLAWQAFSTADAMIAEGQRSPADRAAQGEAWEAAAEGRTA